jgi:hypothetical protein
LYSGPGCVFGGLILPQTGGVLNDHGTVRGAAAADKFPFSPRILCRMFRVYPCELHFKFLGPFHIPRLFLGLSYRVVTSRRRAMTSKAFVCCGFVLALAGLTGCGANISTGSSAASGGAGVSGMVHGGQQPVMGAAVTLYAPGLTGYGSAPTVLATTTTGAGGAFTLPSYTCPTTNDILTYITSVGGDSGSGSNSALKLVAVLGPCSSLSSSTFVFISEATTVAAAYTLAPFAALSGSTTTIGTSAGNLLGLKNVLGPANNLANTTTGYAHGVSDFANMVLPYAEINTLADILAACVNTNGSISASAACGMLFAYATPPGGGAPNDTFQAALDIALNPGNNAAALYTLSNAAAPFQPTLTAAPGDFAVAIQ